MKNEEQIYNLPYSTNIDKRIKKMYYSRYNIDFMDGEYVVVTNILSASVVKFTADKFQVLKEGRLDEQFSKEEIDSLVKMGIVRSEDNEIEDMFLKRKQFLENQRATHFTVTILTTTDCNARCFYCYEKNVKKRHMTLDTAQKVCEYIDKNHGALPVHINWFGGEPLYNSQIMDYISQYLSTKKIEYTSSIITNAYLINEHQDRILNLWHLNRAQVTIDAVGDQYNRIKNYIYKDEPNPFLRVINNIKWLLDQKIRVNIRINFDPQKLPVAIETIKYIRDEFGNPPQLTVYCAWIKDSHVLGPCEYEPNQNPLIKLYGILIDCGYITNIYELGIRPKIFACSVYWDKMCVIGVDGTLCKCQHDVVDEDKNVFGSVYFDTVNNEVVEAWTNPEYLSECMECICLPICQGGCKYSMIQENKNNMCIQIKYCLKEIMELFYNKIYKNKSLQ